MEHPTRSADAPDDLATPVAPPVVAIVVAHDPGLWFEETVEALVGQDYPNLSILVVDAASAEEVKPRVGRVAPGAFVRRLPDNPGFGAAANEVLEVVEGAAFYLLCHDDIAPDRDVVRLLVEEAFRSNAGIVGPKVVAWEDPKRLLQVGEGMDHAGYPVPLVERGELDQEQHDSVGDVFTIPGACTLVRADLFAEVGGFDEGIDYLLDDVSLCWRVHLAGARVIVAPQASVRHLEALWQRRKVDDRRRLQARHRLRVVLSSYSTGGLVRVVPKLAILQIAEAIYAIIVGRTGQARDLASGWWWNLRRVGELREARRQVRSFRRVPDREVRRLMAGGSARLSQFLRGQIGTGEDRFTGLARGGRDAAGVLRSGEFRFVAIVWGIVALVLVAGSRHLLTRGIPSVGELVPFTSSPIHMLRTWASGWRTAGLGSESPAPTAYGLLGGLGLVSAGAMGLLRTTLIIGLLPLGALLSYRLAAPIGSRYAQLAALLVYICNPLPYDALATGRWGALALYGAAPLIVALLARASRLAPFGDVGGAAGPSVRRVQLRYQVLALGLTTAVLGAIVPVAVLVVATMAVALVVGSLLAYRTAGSGRILFVGLGGAMVAVLLHLPWSLDLVGPGTASALMGIQPVASTPDLAALLRFDLGPNGGGPLGWVFIAAAMLPLLIGRDERLAWAVRGWTMAVAFWGLAWVAQRGDLPFALPPIDLLLVPSAVGLSLSTAMGVAAFEKDLPGYRFGWRQIASGLAAGAVLIGTVPIIGAAFDGRWSMPAGDHADALGFIDAENDEQHFRVLWVGHPSALPLGGWELDDGVAYGTTDGGTPRAEDLWVGSDDDPTTLLADAVDLARSGQTARLGQLLAPMGVRYVVVPEQLAPAPFADDSLPLPAGVLATLDAQLDLEPLDVPAGLSVYRNRAFFPTRTAVGSDTDLPEDSGVAGALQIDLSDAPEALPERDGELEWSGPVEGDTTVLLSAAFSEKWRLDVDETEAEHGEPFGWANGFAVADAGAGTLRFDTPRLRYAVLALQVLAWLWVSRTLLRVRVNPRGDERAALAEVVP
ncbi:MAG: glycosyltransferase family 2 protein [Acidimicrobiales bacterium]